MSVFALLVTGFAPGLFWLWYFRQKDDHEPEPRLALLRVFALGMAATAPILLLRPHLQELVPLPDGFGYDAVDAFLLTALPEESAKLAAFLVGAWRLRELDEPLDGLMYGIAAGLGFATVENIVFLARTDDTAVVLQRGFTAVLAHAALSGSAAYGVTRLKFDPRPAGAILAVASFAAAWGFHGLYDLFLFRGGPARFLALLFVLPLLLVTLGLRIRAARARSPDHHPDFGEPRVS